MDSDWLGCTRGITYTKFVHAMPTEGTISGKPTPIPSVWLKQTPPALGFQIAIGETNFLKTKNEL
jgi:hypothetical protein